MRKLLLIVFLFAILPVNAQTFNDFSIDIELEPKSSRKL